LRVLDVLLSFRVSLGRLCPERVLTSNECEKSYNGLQLQEQDLSGLTAVRDDNVEIAV
jgi:hypothetical protein